MFNLYIKQKFVSIGDKYNVLDQNGNVVFKVKSKLISPFYRKKYLYDANENLVMTLRRKVWDILPNYIISDCDGKDICRLRKSFSITHKFSCIGIQDDIKLNGDLFSWDYQIYKNNILTGAVTKKIFNIRDSYTLSIEDPSDAAFFVSCVIAIDNLCHNGNQ